MPIYVHAREFVDPLWMFGAGSTGLNSGPNNSGSANSSANSGSNSNSSGITLMRNFSFHNKGATDRDFNMPISVRCVDKLIYVLDSGNNRVKILNKSGQFVGNVKHDGLNESSATALVLQTKNGRLLLKWKTFRIGK